MAHAVESVLRRPILVGLTEGLLSTSRYRRLRSIRLRPAPTGCVKWILERVRGGRETPKGIRSHVTILQDSGNYPTRMRRQDPARAGHAGETLEIELAADDSRVVALLGEEVFGSPHLGQPAVVHDQDLV